jgi:hypothetical protein
VVHGGHEETREAVKTVFYSREAVQSGKTLKSNKPLTIDKYTKEDNNV